MKKKPNVIFLLVCALVTTMALPVIAQKINDEDVLRAMRDEIKRTMSSLSVEKLQKPYYLEYKLSIRDEHNVKASLGQITDINDARYVMLTVGIRVGSYKFDNTNFFDFGLSLFGSGDDEEGFRNRTVQLETDYASLRRELWLATDAAYKRAAEIYSKKEAALQNRVRKDTVWDFMQIEPDRNNDVTVYPNIKSDNFKDMVKKISGVFRDYPDIYTSTVGMEWHPEKVYFVNSEGREAIRTKAFTGIEIVGASQSVDGMPIVNYFSAIGRVPDDLPRPDSLINAARTVAQKIVEFTAAKELDEPYSGPVVFEGQAAAELFAQIFAPNLAVQRDLMTESGVQEGDKNIAFQNKIGGRVLPEFMSVDDLPLATKYSIEINQTTKQKADIALAGFYTIDDDAVKAQNVNVVVDGYLKALLSSRVPTRRVRSTNGHQRGGAPMYSNSQLIVKEEFQKNREDLLAKAQELCAARELPYTLVIRKIMNQNIMYTTLFSLLSGDYPMPQKGGTIPVVEAYKVYSDGREEPVRGGELSGFSVQAFKDIIATGTDPFVLNLLAPAITSPFVSGGSSYNSASVIVPDLLFEDAEFRPLHENFTKPPILSNPIGEKK